MTAARERWIDRIGPLALAVLALLLGLYQIDRWALWHDEVHSVDAMLQDWPQLLEFAQTREINQLLYFALLKIWTAVSMSDAWIRGLSAVFAALSVAALFGLTRSLFDRRVAWIATILLAGNAFLLQYGQEARTYTLALLLAIVSTWALLRAIRSPTAVRWAIYVALACLIPYTHLVLIGLYPVHVIAVLTAPARQPWRHMIPVAVIIGAATVPPLYLAALQQGSALAWIPSTSAGGVVRNMRRILGAGGPGPLEALGVPASIRLLPALAAALIVAGGIWGVRRASARWAVVLVISWAVLPVLAVLAVSVVKPLLVARYLIYILPACTILMALGVMALPRPWLRAAALAAIVTVALNGTVGWYGSDPRPDWRSATAWVVARSDRDDRAYYIGDFGRVLPYYARQSGAADRIPVGLRHGLDPRAADFPDALARVARNVAWQHRDLWIVVTAPPLTAPERDPRLTPLAGVMRLQEVARFRGIVVAHYVPRP